MALGDLEALSNKEAPPADEDGGSSSNSTATGGGRSNQHQHQEQRIKFSMSDEVLNGSGRNIKPPAAAAAASYAVPDTANANANGNANDNDNASADVTMPSPSPSTSTSMICLPHNAYFCDLRHEVFEGSLACGPPESGLVSKWRMKDRMKTGYVALFLCLNIGVDPPDVIKISPCARLECWIDPFSMPAPKAMDAIGKELERQYELWQPRARYKYQPDPTIEEVKKLCLHCRKNAKTERVLFHYNGHGVPKPTVNGEIWLFNKSYTQYIPLPVYDVESWLGTPSIYVFDCSAAGMIKNAFTEDWGSSGASSSALKDCILLGACGADETLPQSPEFPADLFTSCLTTPIKIALRWFCPRSLLRDSLELDMIDKIPGRQKERKTPLGELNWIFTAVTDTIAWNVLPRELFQRLFRQDLLVASLFRNFLLAERIMRTANCTPVSFPVLPPTHQHPMWDAWDMAAEICLSQLPALLANNNMEYQPSPFFTEQLTAFEVWLEHGSERKKPPEQLPIVLQVLLSQSHRCRALVLLGRFLDMGAWAVDLALSVGIFPYVLKLLQTTATELRQILVFIWTKILALDKSCQVDLVKDGGHQYFIRFLDSTDVYAEQRAMAAFVLAVIVDGHRRGQEACLQSNLINVCLRHMQPSPSGDGHSEPLLLQWLCLCLGKLWEGFPQAQLLGLQENASSVCLPLLSEAQPEVRASAVYALGNLFDTVTESPKEGLGYEEEFDDGVKAKAEQEILRNLLKVLSDGSPLVRAELAVALSRFVTGHNKPLKTMAAAYTKPPSNLGMSINPNSAQPMSSSYNSLSALANIRSPTSSLSNTGQYILPAYVISSNHGPVLRVASDSNTQGREERISTSSPIPSTIMQGSPSSDSSSQKSESRMSLTDGGNNGNVRVTHSKSLDNAVYAQCISAMYTLAKDPSPRVASLGMQLLHMIGVKVHVPKPSRQSSGAPHYRDAAGPSVPPISGLARSFSWLDLNSGNNPLNIMTPPVSPPTRQSYLTGMRRVCSLEFSPHMRSSEAGLADSLLAPGGSAPERSTLLHSTIYNWSCGHFSRPLLYPVHDDEEALTRREDRERLVLERITKCRHSSLTKVSDQISYWDTASEIGSKAVLLHPFVPIIVAGDDRETIRIWNYKEGSLMNTFDNHDGTAGGLSKLCLVNELDDSMLLVASSDGSVRVWKDYMQRDNRRLATAWQSIQGHRPGARGVNAVVDWQQLTGFLFASGEISSIMVWDLDREQLACSIPTPTDICVTALSASQALGGQLVAGSQDGSVRLYDIRTKEMLACSSEPHVHGARVVGIDFQPGLDSAKIVSASIAGDIKFLDLRNSSSPYLEINTYKGSLSALAVHRHAPVIACGSNKQHIKVFDSRSGHQLSAIRYHNSFLVQKIGPVTSLSFHPYNILLAAGATDSIVSIYAGENIQLI